MAGCAALVGHWQAKPERRSGGAFSSSNALGTSTYVPKAPDRTTDTFDPQASAEASPFSTEPSTVAFPQAVQANYSSPLTGDLSSVIKSPFRVHIISHNDGGGCCYQGSGERRPRRRGRCPRPNTGQPICRRALRIRSADS